MSLSKKIFISCFILFNFLTMIRVHLPLEKKLFSSLYKPIDSYLSFFSIYQDWFMFAPDPGKTNVYLTADVLFDDGTKTTYSFPNPMTLNHFEKYLGGEKFRKIISEGIRKDSNSFMWRDTAKFALRKIKDESFDKIPVKVFLNRHWNEIPEINKEFRPHLARNLTYQKNTFYTYEVYNDKL